MATIEDLVLDAINKGKTRAKVIEIHVASHPEQMTGPVTFRTIDRALQRLRKKKAIEYISPVQGWKVRKP